MSELNFLTQDIGNEQSVEDLIKNILDDASNTRTDINKTLSELMEMITGQSDSEEIDISALIGFAGPIAKDLYDLLLKNNKNKIEMAKVIQQFYSIDKKFEFGLNGNEDDDLFSELEKDLTLIKKDTEGAKDELNGLKDKIAVSG